MDTRRDTFSQWRAVECDAYTLFVHRMTGLVQCREYYIAEIVLADMGGDAHITGGKARAEWMMGQVKPATVEVVSQALSEIQGKFQLGCFGKVLSQARVISDRLLANRSHHRGKLAFELAKKLAD
jgi:hypothetical protein